MNGDLVYTASSYGFSPNLESGTVPNIDITSSELKKYLENIIKSGAYSISIS